MCFARGVRALSCHSRRSGHEALDEVGAACTLVKEELSALPSVGVDDGHAIGLRATDASLSVHVDRSPGEAPRTAPFRAHGRG